MAWATIAGRVGDLATVSVISTQMFKELVRPDEQAVTAPAFFVESDVAQHSAAQALELAEAIIRLVRGVNG